VATIRVFFRRRAPALCVLSLAVALLILEWLVAIRRIDARLLAPLLYVVGREYIFGEEVRIFRPSNDVPRVFETVPDAEASFAGLTHPLEPLYGPGNDGQKRIEVRINNLGFRDDRDRSPTKAAGVFRIVVLGGSNVFGPTVSNRHTYPAFMQELLNRDRPGHFEVWNGGLNSYVLSQKIAYARSILASFVPDMIVLSHENTGRRAFLGHDPAGPRERELYGENIPMLYFDNAVFRRAHDVAVQRSSLYRALALSLIRLSLGGMLGSRAAEVYGTEYAEKCARYADEISSREYRDFVRDAGGVRLVVVEPVFGWGDTVFLAEDPAIPRLKLWQALRNKPPEFRQIHPPSYVYRFYAEWLLQKFHERGLLSGAEAKSPGELLTRNQML
jgi:hypothetical protein